MMANVLNLLRLMGVFVPSMASYARHLSLRPRRFVRVLRRGRTVSRIRGFTIIELLVVLAIIALIASVVVAMFSSARAKSRDATREENMKSLENALALYATNTRTFPHPTPAGGVCLGATDGSDTVSQQLVSSGAIGAIPRDPMQNCATTNQQYHYTSTDGSTYTITYYLETSSIPGKSAGRQTVSP